MKAWRPSDARSRGQASADAPVPLEGRAKRVSSPRRCVPPVSEPSRASTGRKPITGTAELSVQSNLFSPSTVLPWERELLLSCAPRLLEAILGDEDDDDDKGSNGQR